VGFLSEFFARITGSKTGQDTVKTSPQQELKMAKVLVLYHSMYGHIETVIG
jgi:NAD(P)H dehydrogenase (quinone)